MSDDWVQYTVRAGETKLQDILVRYGYFTQAQYDATSDPMTEDHKPEVILTKTWLSDKNPDLHKPDRNAYTVKPGEKIWLPPHDVPANMTPRQYVCNGTEGTLGTVATWIKTSHGTDAASLEPSAVPLDRLTPEYLCGLPENIPYTEQRGSNGAGTPVQAGDVITYFVTLRPTSNRDVAPGSKGSAPSNSVVSGPAAFTVTVALLMPDPPETQLLPVLTKPAANPDDNGNDLAVNGKFRDIKVNFDVTVTKNGTADPYRTTFRIYDADGKLYFEEAHTDGDFIQVGKHTWGWDGFNSADDTVAVLDTRVLRKKLLLQVTVEPMQGIAAVHHYYLANKTPKGEWADLKISLATRTIDVEYFVKFERITDDPAVMGLAVFGMALAAGLVAGLAMLLEWGGAELYAWATHAKNMHQKKSIENALFAGTAVAAALAAVVVAIVEFNKIHLSDEEMAKAIGLLKAGIKRYWSRTGDRAIDIGGVKYQVTATCTARSDDAVKFAMMKPLFSGQRGVNLGMVIPGCPVIVTYDPDNATKPGYSDEVNYAGAHELGHTILADDMSKSFSIRHKNTTGGPTSQHPNINAPRYVDTPGEIDLMKYFQMYARDSVTHEEDEKQIEYVPGDYYTRMTGVESDVLRLFRTTRVEWCEDKDLTNLDFSTAPAAQPGSQPANAPANPPAGPSGGGQGGTPTNPPNPALGPTA